MAALDKDRATPERDGRLVGDPLATAATIYAGAMYVLDASGNATAATAAATTPVRAVARQRANAAEGDTHTDGALGIYQFANSTGAAEITRTEIGSNAYAADDQTVSKTGTCIAGIVFDVDDGGVWVRIGTQAPDPASGP